MIANSEQSNEADKWRYIALKSISTDDNCPIKVCLDYVEE